jgi:lipoate-protein ligase A
VDHREDWTYTLVIPRGHELEELRATQSYRVIHEALAEALREQGAAVATKQTADENEPPSIGPFGVCFQRAEIFDVVDADTGSKIAGAAQKRNRHGLLFQGSIWRPAVGKPIDWECFEQSFLQGLARALGTTATSMPWPDLNEDELSALTEQYSSAEWMEHR